MWVAKGLGCLPRGQTLVRFHAIEATRGLWDVIHPSEDELVY